MADFYAKIHQIRCRLGLRPRPRWGSLQRSPRPPSWWGGPQEPATPASALQASILGAFGASVLAPSAFGRSPPKVKHILAPLARGPRRPDLPRAPRSVRPAPLCPAVVSVCHDAVNETIETTYEPANVRWLFLFISNTASILVIIKLFTTLFVFYHVYNYNINVYRYNINKLAKVAKNIYQALSL